MPPADPAAAAEPVVYRVRVTAGELSDEIGRSTDHARWFTREEAEALPLVELAAEGVRRGFAPES